ncbi:MAG: DNA-binding protein [Nocardioidaceae bacterium]|nr:DNA-binding protein [Nocardioidaceae bacterium]
MTKPAPVDAERRLLDYTRAAAYLGISVRGFKELARTGEVLKVPVGNRVLFDRVDLDSFVDRAKRLA